METVWVAIALGMLIVISLILILRLELCHKSLIYHLKTAHSEIKSSIASNEVEVSGDLMDQVKDELNEVIMDAMGSMKVPTALDHLAGVFANVMQMREQWKIQKEASELQSGLINPIPSGDEYGSTTTQD